jgi:aminopeptidase
VHAVTNPDERTAERIDRLARLAVEVGANVQPDQVVVLTAAPGMEPAYRAIAEHAYRRGARFVDLVIWDGHLKRSRIEHAREETLDWVPPWYRDRMLAQSDHHVARIVLVPLIDPAALEGVDPVRAGRDALPAQAETGRVVNERTTNWTILPHSTPGWARLVHPDLPEAEAVERLWQELEHVCRLDEPDPAAAWLERGGMLRAAAAKLNELRLDALHFEGPGTDLRVGLLAGSLWTGAWMETVDGVRHMPNIPTEEIATAPDPTRVDGVVTATKPLSAAGLLVEGLRVRFEDGRAVEIDADANGELVRARAATDEGASRLGEVALVDREGRIGRTGTIFRNTLLDENAASHIALGNAYAVTAEPEYRDRINASAIHIDFMIGSDEVAVTGVTGAGDRVPLLRDGAWQI